MDLQSSSTCIQLELCPMEAVRMFPIICVQLDSSCVRSIRVRLRQSAVRLFLCVSGILPTVKN